METFYLYLFSILDILGQSYDYFCEGIRDYCDANIVIAMVAVWFAFREWNSKKGHSLEVIYSVSYSCYQQPKISDLWIYNKKNKIEVITEINVLFGANWVLQLKEFSNNAFILNPNEMKKVDLDPVSIYAVNCKPVNMKSIFQNPKIKKTFFLTTPDGRIKAKNLKQIPYDTFIKDTLYKGAFGYIYHRQYPVDNMVLDFKIKYFGYCWFSEKIKYPFYIYQDGIIHTEGFEIKCIKVDLEKYNNIEKIKKFLSGKRLIDKKHTIEVYQRSLCIDEVYSPLKEQDISSMIFSKWKYFFIEPLVRWYRNRKLKIANRKLKIKTNNKTKN